MYYIHGDLTFIHQQIVVLSELDRKANHCYLKRRRMITVKASHAGTPPLIGLISGLSNDGHAQTVGRSYTRSLINAGGVPVLLPTDLPEDMIEAALSQMDGILLTGGSDVDPACYGQEKHEKTYGVLPIRDQLEFRAARFCVDRHIPLLGICRGIQSLTVALGGSLIQDLPSHNPSGLDHHASSKDANLKEAHQVDVRPGTRLAGIVGPGMLGVNTYHHQAADRVPPCMVVSARATDGVIEAVEIPGDTFILGVQWHPEAMADYQEQARAIFRAFVESASRAKGAAV